MAFLFIVILTFGSLSIYYILRLSSDADKILKNNYETLVYDNSMLKVLEEVPTSKNAIEIFDFNLKKQEGNITEVGEKEATALVRTNFEKLLTSNPANDSIIYHDIRQAIQLINDLNQQALVRKNAVAQKTADDATVWLTVIFTILTLLAFTIVVNFPEVIAKPIRELSEGISAIANKDYQKRIHLEQKDEFGDLANAFNIMAEKLDEYEHSNLNKLIFEKRRIETIINQMSDGIIGFDHKKDILFLNVVSENLLGLKEKDVVGKYAPDVALKNDLMRKLLQDDAGKELKIYADGKESYFNKENYLVKNEEHIIGEVIVLNNITPFHELDLAKTNFIATVSHELKTPISSIKMSSQLLSDDRVGSLNPEQQELIKSIQDDSERLLKITSELLNVSQVESGNIHLNIRPVDAKRIIAYAFSAVKTQADQKNIQIETSYPENLPVVLADDEKTSWVLTNFLSNAVRYSFENSKVQLSVEVIGKEVKFTVQDHGQGIPQEYQDKIFNRYFRIPGSRKEGTGLGLAICKDFIEAQEGRISLESEMGAGSKFSFSLKVAG